MLTEKEYLNLSLSFTVCNNAVHCFGDEELHYSGLLLRLPSKALFISTSDTRWCRAPSLGSPSSLLRSSSPCRKFSV